MTHEEKAREIISRWDSTFGREGIGTLLMAGQIKNLEILIEDALASAEKKGREEGYDEAEETAYCIWDSMVEHHEAEVKDLEINLWNEAIAEAKKVVLSEEKDRWTTRAVRSLIEIADSINKLKKGNVELRRM